MKSPALILFIGQLGALLQSLSAALEAERLAALPVPPTPEPEPEPPTPPAPPADVFLSDLEPSSAANGWGPYQRDRSNGEQGSDDGSPLTIRGTVYQKGLGVHAASTLVYPLGGFCSRFRAVLGIDDSIAENSSPPAAVTFRVLADGVEIYASPELGRSSQAVLIDLPVAGVQSLALEVLPGATAGWDHADWADARLSFASQAMLNQFILFQAGRSGNITPPAPPTPPETPPPSGEPSGDLNLPRAAWWGGPAYYSSFSVAAAAGWTDPDFFPIGVFYGKPSHATQLMAAGINVYMRAEYDGSSVASMTDVGMQLILQPEWTAAQVGNNPLVVGWHVSEEVDMAPGTEAQRLAIHNNEVNRRRALNDGRFLQANFGNGVLGTWWSPNIMDDLIYTTDVTTVDKYAYTSPDVRFEYGRSPFWPSGKNAQTAGAYGWQQDRMVTLGSTLNGVPTSGQKPNWVFVETARPFLTEAGSETISLPRINGAVWNSIIHGASGVAYFQHNNNGLAGYGTYSIIECPPERTAHIAALNAQIQSLAPVLNTQPYVWSFGSNLETSLRAHGGNAYIFAMTDGGSGNRTFALPPSLASATTAVVVDESRSVNITAGQFTDNFSAEHVCHIYRIAIP